MQFIKKHPQDKTIFQENSINREDSEAIAKEIAFGLKKKVKTIDEPVTKGDIKEWDNKAKHEK